MKRRCIKRVPSADKLIKDAQKQSSTKEGQLEVLRWWRDVNCRGNLQAQLACATAIDKLKGYYQ